MDVFSHPEFKSEVRLPKYSFLPKMLKLLSLSVHDYDKSNPKRRYTIWVKRLSGRFFNEKSCVPIGINPFLKYLVSKIKLDIFSTILQKIQVWQWDVQLGLV